MNDCVDNNHVRAIMHICAFYSIVCDFVTINDAYFSNQLSATTQIQWNVWFGLNQIQMN